MRIKVRQTCWESPRIIAELAVAGQISTLCPLHGTMGFRLRRLYLVHFLSPRKCAVLLTSLLSRPPSVDSSPLYTALLSLPACHHNFVPHGRAVTLSWVASSPHTCFSSDWSAWVLPCVLPGFSVLPAHQRRLPDAQWRIKYFLSSHLWSQLGGKNQKREVKKPEEGKGINGKIK